MIWICFAVLLAACFAAGATGGLFPPGAWYARLSKPWFTPPDWLFPVAWTTLYLCIAAAGARVAVSSDNALPMALWALQIALNALWTPVFFGLRRMQLGMLILSALWLSVAALMLTSWQVDWIAGLLLVPYLAWVSVAGALNLAVIRLNPQEAGRTTAS